MKRMSILWLILSLLGLNSLIFSGETQLSEHHLLYKLIKNRNNCVTAIDGNKIYLRSESIVPKDGRLFVDLDGQELGLLPVIQFDENGHFIESNISESIIPAAARTSQTKGPCPNCDVNTDGKGFCRNPACWFFEQKVL